MYVMVPITALAVQLDLLRAPAKYMNIDHPFSKLLKINDTPQHHHKIMTHLDINMTHLGINIGWNTFQ